MRSLGQTCACTCGREAWLPPLSFFLSIAFVFLRGGRLRARVYCGRFAGAEKLASIRKAKKPNEKLQEIYTICEQRGGDASPSVQPLPPIFTFLPLSLNTFPSPSPSLYLTLSPSPLALPSSFLPIFSLSLLVFTVSVVCVARFCLVPLLQKLRRHVVVAEHKRLLRDAQHLAVWLPKKERVVSESLSE